MGNTNICYCTKDNLYKYISQLKKWIGLPPSKTGIDFYDVCSQIKGITIKTVNFQNKSLRGLSLPKDRIILLNSARTPTERNFDCAHEFIHVIKHKDENFQTFKCSDILQPEQNPFLEWQANEGAAEMLVPYKVFIPLFCKGVNRCRTWCEYYGFLEWLAKFFRVPTTVIELRVENLKYEILQYEEGSDINDIELLSHNQQERKGIKITSYNTLANLLDRIPSYS